MAATVSELYVSHGLQLKPHARGAKGEELCGPCPKCGGKDRFVVYTEQNDGLGSWYCRGCEHGGDGIELLIWCDGLSYPEAARRTGAQLKKQPPPHARPSEPKRRASADSLPIEAKETSEPTADTAAWRAKASEFAERCHEELLRDREALAYLARRGLDLAAVRKYSLGWCPGENGNAHVMRWRKSWGIPDGDGANGRPKTKLWLPRGIVIPAFDKSEAVIRLRIRRPDADRKASLPDLKYYIVPGSSMRPMWLPVEDPLLPSVRAAVVVEAELDALLVHHAASSLASVLASMTAKISALPPDIMAEFSSSDFILVATDTGDVSRAGYDGWTRWRDTFSQAKHWPCVGGKDPGEMFTAGGDIFAWVVGGYPQVQRVAIAKAMAKRSAEPARRKEVPPPDPIPDEGGKALSESQRKRLAVERQAAILNAERAALPLSGTYLSIPLLLDVLRAHGLRVVPHNGDIRIEGLNALPASDQSRMLGFMKRHRFLFDIIAERLNAV